MAVYSVNTGRFSFFNKGYSKICSKRLYSGYYNGKPPELRKRPIILAIVKQLMTKKFLLALLFAFVYSAGLGQTSEPKFNLISATDGIIPGRIGCITRDREGVMWFSDQTNKGHHPLRWYAHEKVAE